MTRSRADQVLERLLGLATDVRVLIGIVLVVVAVLATIGWRRSHRKEQREALREAVRAFWEREHEGWQVPGGLPERAPLQGKVLPIRVVDGHVHLADDVYEGLDDAIRPATLEDATSVAELESQEILYSLGSVPWSANLTVIDLRSGVATSRAHFSGERPPPRLTLQLMTTWQERFWAPVAAHLNALPRLER